MPSGGLPRPLRYAAIAFAAVLLTGFFMYLRFPYDRLADTLSAELERSRGVKLSMAELGPSPGLLGPGLVATGVRITARDGTVTEFDRVRVRPAWSLSWLLLTPALVTELEGAQGEAEGTYTASEPATWVGRLVQFDLSRIGADRLGPGTQLEGRADADLELSLGPDGPEGHIQFVARDGRLGHPQLPLPVPFEQLSGDVTVGGAQQLEVHDLALVSSLASGNLSGTIGRAARPDAAPLALDVKLTAAPAIQGALRSQGVKVGRNGEIALRIEGTLGRPLVR